MFLRSFIVVVLLAFSHFAFATSDYAREKKWEDEIAPGIVVGDPVHITQKNGHKFFAIYTEAKDAKMGVVVVHGIGIHPDWGMIGTLRQQLAEQGYTTLSIQMPILAVDAKAEDYPPTFPEAAERLQLAVDYLKSKGYKKVAIVSHSMGSRMTHFYMEKNPPGVAAWAALGLASSDTYKGIKVPVLDLYGANDLPPVLEHAKQRLASLKGNPASKQVVIPGADHFYANHEDAMVKAVKDFLDGVN
jgi:dienelactone hydrolase